MPDLCRIHAKTDVTQRLKELMQREQIHVEILSAEVPPERREAWYEAKLRQGMQVCIAHPKLLMSGLDLLDTPSIFFYESGYSTHVLRQASRRSWRIGQRRPVRVCYMIYADTAQERCLRLMGKKMLVSLALEGKLASHGLTAMDEDDDLLTALARELVTEKGIGERAAAVWRSLRHETAAVVTPVPIISAAVQPERELELPDTSLLDADAVIAQRPAHRTPRDHEQLSFAF
jgi:hypothetical protein